MISPGSFYDVFIGFMSPIEHLGSVSLGMKFEIREGRRIVGHGMVKRIIDLKFSAIRSQIDIRHTDE